MVYMFNLCSVTLLKENEKHKYMHGDFLMCCPEGNYSSLKVTCKILYAFLHGCSLFSIVVANSATQMITVVFVCD